MRRYLLALALVLLLTADLGWKAWSERPYIVTGWSHGWSGDVSDVSVQYTVPGGGTATSRELGGVWTVPRGKPARSCLDDVKVGRKVPDCVLSYRSAFERLSEPK